MNIVELSFLQWNVLHYKPVRCCACIWEANAVRFPYTLHIWAYPNMDTHIMALGFVGMPKYGVCLLVRHAQIWTLLRCHSDVRHGQIWSLSACGFVGQALSELDHMMSQYADLCSGNTHARAHTQTFQALLHIVTGSLRSQSLALAMDHFHDAVAGQK